MGDEKGQSIPLPPVEAPRGFLAARVDEKGRLKLPASIVQYLEACGERKLFITTLDGATVRMYLIWGWREAATMLSEPGDDIQAKKDVSFIANHFGADDEMDGQGRVLVPTELRRRLKLEGEQVFLRCLQQRIDVIKRDDYERQLTQALDGLEGKAQLLEAKGLR